jgi:hypothetical protein
VLGVDDGTTSLRARSATPHQSQAGRETIRGLALGHVDGQPVVVFWFVRDLTAFGR